MCGIAGYLSFDGRPASEELLRQMAWTLRHRGPDGEGIHIDGSLGLAHRRLSILDLGGGGQPMSTRDGAIWIVFNGEIYNFVELREELIAQGHAFSNRSDTEVILNLYREKALEFLAALRGMFAFALWDARHRRLVLARDRVGIKPLYYHLGPRSIVFGSEIKSLLVHPDVGREIDPAALKDFLTYQYVPAPRSVFRTIRKLPPASVLVIEGGRAEEKRYWRLPREVESRPTDVWREELDSTLTEAVRIHMRSDVPVGALLSGGLDSSLVVALAAGSAGGSLKTFSVGFPEADHSELPYARQVATRYRTSHTEHLLEPRGVEALPSLVGQFDEPFADPSSVPCAAIAEVAARQVKVCLSGDGGDEGFAGYHAYRLGSSMHRADLLPLAVRRFLLGPLERRLPEWVPLRGGLRFLTLPPDDRYVEIMGSVDAPAMQWLLEPDLLASAADHDPYAWLRDLYRGEAGRDEISRLQRVDVESYLPDDILVKADRTSMLHSLELRVPLLDHKVLELAFRMPTRLKYRGGVGKRILRETFAGRLPEAVVTRGKQGFGMPLKSWLRGDLQAFVTEILSDRRTRQRGVLSGRGLDRLLEADRRGARSLSSEIWTVLVLELWFRACVDGSEAKVGSAV
ncbi:MAG TPA: asparagine synthase (glutamine-hydrolyzing) [Candidatus Polarisedimenticolia bacterium]|nr:asparagine synthase (glutamine-hydrolyzing) [Candidatus Polarisedimenticolia bacterium]